MEGAGMNLRMLPLSLTLMIGFSFVAKADTPRVADILVVVGAAGTPQYGEMFASWLEDWKQVANEAGAELTTIGVEGADASTNDLQALKDWIGPRVEASSIPIWIVLIGHGTYAQNVAKFNLRGPDVSVDEFANLLKPIERPIVIVNCASGSGPFINGLSSPRRVIVTSTKSGSEQNFARFGEFFARAIASPQSDLDHDDEVSVHEAFLSASGEVRKFYDSQARISTEHALIDDNGDGKGTPATMFRGVRSIAAAKDGSELDGINASRTTLSPAGSKLKLTEDQATRRAELETQLDQLRSRKSQITESAYFDEIEPLMIELARLYRDAEAGSN